MKKIELKELQQIEFGILLEFDKVCQQHGLRYYIDGGTLLGAVCYDGFIPWDDDIDIKMPRPDYEKLIHLQDCFPTHILIDVPRQDHCEYTFLKLIDNRTILNEKNRDTCKTTGVYIDILPMDGHPDDKKACKRHLRKLGRLNSLFHASQNHFNELKRSRKLVSRIKGYIYDRLYSPWKLYNSLTRIASKYDYDSSDVVGLLVEGDPLRERFKKAWLEPVAMMQFEGYTVPAPNKAEKHLSIFYKKPISRKLYYHNLPMILPDHKHDIYWKE